MAQKVFRTGNSLAVTIPARFAQDLGIRAGDRVKVRVERVGGKITYHFSGAQQLPLSNDFLSRRKKK